MSCCCEDLKSTVYRMQDQMNAIETYSQALKSGHPIWMIQNADDILLFDTNGDGTGVWTGWSYCDGVIRNGFIVPDLRDKFVVGAGISYNTNDVGGEATHVLTVPEIPVHNHALTDPGHTHTVTDPTHTHTVTDPGHIHTATQVAHAHGFTTSVDGSHTHVLTNGADIVNSHDNGLFLKNDGGASEVDDGGALAANGDHTHTGTTDSQTPAITVAPNTTGNTNMAAATGVTNQTNTTGITLANAGGGLAHNNLPPFYSLIFAIKVF